MRVAAILALAACGGMQHTDAGLEAAWIATNYVDYLQTDTIATYCDDPFTESNPLIDTCQSDGPFDVASYFAITFAVHLAISAALPRGAWRTTWQALTLGVSAKTVHRNYNDGVRIR